MSLLLIHPWICSPISITASLLYFVVPITQTWREELKRFTEAAGFKSKNPYTNTTSYQVPPSRQGSRQGERPPPSRGREFPPPSRNGEKPPSRNGEIPPSRNGEKPPTRQGESRLGERPSLLQQGLPMQHIAPESDSDLAVSDINFLLRFYQRTIKWYMCMYKGRCMPFQQGTFWGCCGLRSNSPT